MKTIAIYLKQGILMLLMLTMQTVSAKENKKDKPNFTVESVNVIHSDLKVSGGNLVFSDDAKLRIENTLIFSDKKIPDSLKIKIELKGEDANKKDYSNSVSYWYYPKLKTNGAYITIKATPKSQIRISAVVHFVDDWQGETAYLKIDGTQTNFAILLNGIQKPNGNGKCFYGKCFCFASQDGPDSKLIQLNTAKIKQTLSTNNKDKQSYLDISISINETSQNKDVPTLAQLVMWGEMDVYFTAKVAGKPIKWRYEDGGISMSDEWQQPAYRVNVTGLGDVRLTEQVLHFREVKGAYFGVSSVSLYLRDGKGYEKPTSENFTWTETWVIDQNNNLSAQPKLKNIFMNQTDDSKTISVLIGLNKTKSGTPNELEKVLSTRHVKSYAIITWQAGNEKPVFHTVNASETKDGNWEYSDQIEKAKAGTPQFGMISLEMFFISPFNDTFKFTSVFKEKLGDKKDWDYKIYMSPIAIDNPVLEPSNGGMTNVLGLTIPSSSVTINGGSITFSENAKFSIGISNTNVGNGGINYNKVPKVKFDIKNFDPNKRVFYHWGSTVSTSNPKLNVNVDSQKFKGHSISSAELLFITDKNDTIVYESNGKIATSLDGKVLYYLLEKTEKIKYIKENYDFGKSSLKVVEEKNIKALYFSFSLEKGSSIPASMKAIVEIKTCNKESEYISVSLKFDSKTGLWTGAQSIVQSADCQVEVKGFKVTIVNACGDTYSAKNGYFDETKNEWICQDECLKVKLDDNQLCGKTDHL